MTHYYRIACRSGAALRDAYTSFNVPAETGDAEQIGGPGHDGERPVQITGSSLAVELMDIGILGRVVVDEWPADGVGGEA